MSMNLRRLTALAARGQQLAGKPTATGRPWYRITNAADRATVYIYDEISDFGVSADSFVRELEQVSSPTIDLRVNSPGGAVFDAVAIYSALRNHKATVEATVDGIAASAASFITMSGDTIAIEKPARMMIHDAAGLVLGDAGDMREMADLLDELSDTIASIYADRAGGAVAAWRESMRKTTWYSADAAVKAGLADRVVGQGVEAAPENRRSKLIRARHRAHYALGGV